MRCTQCGWIVENSPCPCGATKAARQAVVPIGTKVVARPCRGPSRIAWEHGTVSAHVGRMHQITTQFRQFWCETMDLLPESPRRAEALTADTPRLGDVARRPLVSRPGRRRRGPAPARHLGRRRLDVARRQHGRAADRRDRPAERRRWSWPSAGTATSSRPASRK